MKNGHWSDEEILSFLIGDCSDDLKNEINASRRTDDALREQVRQLNAIKTEIEKNSFTHLSKEKPSFSFLRLLTQTGVAMALFISGLFVESQFEFLSREKTSEKVLQGQDIEIFSWDKPQDSSFM